MAKNLVTYIVNFQHTYRTTPSTHFPEGHKKTVHRCKEVQANNPNSARRKAVKMVGRPGHYHSFEIKVKDAPKPKGFLSTPAVFYA